MSRIVEPEEEPQKCEACGKIEICYDIMGDILCGQCIGWGEG